jgi:hypothetical protein
MAKKISGAKTSAPSAGRADLPVSRGAIRRTQREQEAYMQSELNESMPAVWSQLEPLLDEAISSLGTADRALLALRFYENKSGPEAAALLGINEAAVHKRTARALDKLRKFFSQRGVALTTTVIAGAVAANSVQAAPAGLVQTISIVAAAKRDGGRNFNFNPRERSFENYGMDKSKNGGCDGRYNSLRGWRRRWHLRLSFKSSDASRRIAGGLAYRKAGNRDLGLSG